MLLIRTTAIKLSLTLTLLCGVTAAQAQTPIAHLEDGFYVRTDGVVKLCRPFEVPKEMGPRDALEISYIYQFSTSDSVNRVPSDLDPKCEFVETNTRTNFDDHTILSRNDVEICSGKVKSDITTKLTIHKGRLRLDLEDKFGPGYFCDWVKAVPTQPSEE